MDVSHCCDSLGNKTLIVLEVARLRPVSREQRTAIAQATNARSREDDREHDDQAPSRRADSTHWSPTGVGRHADIGKLRLGHITGSATLPVSLREFVLAPRAPAPTRCQCAGGGVPTPGAGRENVGVPTGWLRPLIHCAKSTITT